MSPAFRIWLWTSLAAGVAFWTFGPWSPIFWTLAAPGSALLQRWLWRKRS